MLEVELKIPVSTADAVVDRLGSLGAESTGRVRQHDTYFAHPGRDFAATDEALRLRREGDRLELTYKGPRRDAAAKVREEHNVQVADDPAPLLAGLGFTAVAGVVKTRRSWRLRGATVCLDEVEGLGTFVEVEIMEGEVDAVQNLVRALGLDPARAEPRSYLELLAQ